MKIVIDARESGTSTGRYIDKLIEYLAKLPSSHEFIILTKSHRLDYIGKIAPSFKAIRSDFKEFTFDEQLGLKKQLKSLQPDLVHFGMVQQPVLYRGKVVTTIHDLSTVRFINPDKNPIVFKLKRQVYVRVIKRATKASRYVMTPSEFVKQDLIKFTGAKPEKFIVTYESADAISDKPEPLPDVTNKQFIMYVGRPTPHKNLERLIEAFFSLKDKYPDLVLVLAGKKDPNYIRIKNIVRSKNIKDVVFTNFISDGQLRWLYEHCQAYVFPSLSEGFGLPGLEAMAQGAPVVSSNATCLPEINGDAASYFDPLSVKDMAKSIEDVLVDKKLRDSLIEKGHKQAAKYSWKRMAEQTLEVYNRAL